MNFEEWWDRYGSGMAPRSGEDAEAHVRRVCAIAWYEAKPQIEQVEFRLNCVVRALLEIRRSFFLGDNVNEIQSGIESALDELELDLNDNRN